MKIHIGSKNETKVGAVTEGLNVYPLFAQAEFVPIDVQIDVYGHPKTLEDILSGAIARAKQAFGDCDYSVGIESGLMPVPQTKTGFIELAVCAIFDGEEVHLGFAPAFEWPRAVAEGILNQGLDGSQAMKAAGLTGLEKIGTEKGAISLLTKGRMDRKEQNRLAVQMALIHLENPEHY